MLNSGLLKKKVPLSMSQIDFTWASCNQGKGKTLSFPLHIDNSQACSNLIHTDVWGIAPAVSHLGNKYYVSFIDDYSRFTWVYIIHAKSDVFIVFTQFLAMVENQFSSQIKTLCSDSGEDMSHQFQYSSNPFK